MPKKDSLGQTQSSTNCIWRLLFAGCLLLSISLLVPSKAIARQSAKSNTGVTKKLSAFLKTLPNDKSNWAELISKQEFTKKELSPAEAKKVRKILSDHYADWVKKNRKAEMDAKVLKVGKKSMPFWYKVYGKKPKGGRSLYISMHGGGSAPKRVNDQQWENQKRLYRPKEGVYVAPRAPVDAWNMWHIGEIDTFYERLVENMIVFHDVDPDKVYLMGYSAGGDGVYQVATRWADHLGAAAMMAGHPNESTPVNLRNLPFILQMGGKDAAFKRNKIAAQWKEKLANLKKADPKGYPHLVKIYPNYGHWMNREDRIAVPWMAKNKRKRNPSKIVWLQDDVTHRRFYWLGNGDNKIEKRSHLTASRKGQEFQIQKAEKVDHVILYLNDKLVDFKKNVVIKDPSGKVLFDKKVSRNIKTLANSYWDRGDQKMMADAIIRVKLADSTK